MKKDNPEMKNLETIILERKNQNRKNMSMNYEKKKSEKGQL